MTRDRISISIGLLVCLWQLAVANSLLSTPTKAPAKDSITSLPSFTTSAPAIELRDTAKTCGYVKGDVLRPITCRETCGFLRMSWGGNGHFGCCGSDGCRVYTTCLENESTNDEFALICTSTKSSCATYTWSGESYVLYSCAKSRTTINVSTNTTGPDLTTSSATTAGTGAPRPTKSGGNTPGLGHIESDLGPHERTIAAVGSSVLGGVLLGCFLMFGCFLNPPGEDATGETEAEPEAEPSPPPGENAGLLGNGQEMHTPVSSVSESRFLGQQPVTYHTQLGYA